MLRNLALLLVSGLAFWACSYTPEQDAFVAKLGDDTLVVETFYADADSVLAKVILRTPKTSLKSYKLDLGDDYGIKKMVVFEHNPELGFADEGREVQRMTRIGDSLRVETETPVGLRTSTMAYRNSALPFIDMVHWPFDIALKAAKASGRDTTHQYLVSGNSLSDFIIAKIREDSMTIRHPFRGVMGVRVMEEGDLVMLDAAQTTRKLVVHRQVKADMPALAKRYVEADKAGQSVGNLSGAEVLEKSIGGADIKIEYGTPLKRNREIFGSLVPWGEVWRTGANRATHISTTKSLKFGEVILPAGEYTLFTVPEEDGGELIINKETNQNGNSYKPEFDLGRVAMQISKIDNPVEVFTIDLEDSGNKGILQLIWDQTVFSIGFEVL